MGLCPAGVFTESGERAGVPQGGSHATSGQWERTKYILMSKQPRVVWEWSNEYKILVSPSRPHFITDNHLVGSSDE